MSPPCPILQDGPAARAGVIAGDQLISIDGVKPGAGITAGWYTLW